MALSCSHQAAHLVEEDDRFVIYAPAIMNAEVVAYQGDIQQIKTLGVGRPAPVSAEPCKRSLSTD